MKQILNQEQKMYLILYLASGMRDECAGKEEQKADYQISSRIYANAFASLVQCGIQPVCNVKDGVPFLSIELEGNLYGCPARTVKNIMKAEFSLIEKKLPDIVPLLKEEEARLAAESKKGKQRRKQNVSANVVQETGSLSENRGTKEHGQGPEKLSNPEKPGGQMSTFTEKLIADAGQEKSAEQLEPSSDMVNNGNGEAETEIETDSKEEQMGDKAEELAGALASDVPCDAGGTDCPMDVVPDVTIAKESTDQLEAAAAGISTNVSNTADANVQMIEALQELSTEAGGGTMVPDTSAEGQSQLAATRTKVQEGNGPEQQQETPDIPEPIAGQEGWEDTTEEAAPAAHAFQKKQRQEGAPAAMPMPDDKDNRATPVPDPAPTAKTPLGMFSRFLPKNKKQEVVNAVPAARPVQENTGAAPDVIPQAGEEMHGERICHTHYVMLRKTYGTQVTGPYTIQIWPTEVIEMHPERIPSAIFVRVQAPNGTVICKVNEGRAKYIVLEIDNKQFNVFGFWEAGGFISEVAAINKTASIYTMSEEVETECPRQVSDAFLDQFRLREPHRPEFFVVPIGNVIQDEGNVSIAAFIRVKDKNYPVSARGGGNTLRFTYENQLSEISGRWENGKFVFTIRAVEQG